MTASLPVWVDGHVRSGGTVSVRDDGLLLGLGVFETVRMAAGRPFLMEEHLERMARSAAFLGLPDLAWDPVVSVAELAGPASEALGTDEFGMRLTWTRGAPGCDPSLVVIPRALPATEAPVRLMISPWPKQAEDPFESHKTVARTRNALARDAARTGGFFDALQVTLEGDVSEGTVCNLFVVTPDGTLATPALDRGCLPGTTRAVVLADARAAGLEVVEARVTLSDLAASAEVFTTNSLDGLLAVASVDHGGTWPAPGPVTMQLAEAWNARLAAFRMED